MSEVTQRPRRNSIRRKCFKGELVSSRPRCRSKTDGREGRRASFKEAPNLFRREDGVPPVPPQAAAATAALDSSEVGRRRDKAAKTHPTGQKHAFFQGHDRSDSKPVRLHRSRDQGLRFGIHGWCARVHVLTDIKRLRPLCFGCCYSEDSIICKPFCVLGQLREST